MRVLLRPDCLGDSPIRHVWLIALVLLGLMILPVVVLPANAVDGQYIANNTPGYVFSATNLGPADASQTITVSIWLQPHNRSALDALAQDLYNPSSPSYRHWLKSSDIAAQFAPTAAEAKTVQEFFESNHLKIVGVGPDNFYVRAQGTVADVEKAFHLQLNNYQVGSQTLRSNAADPYIEGPAAALVQAVSGLDNGAFEQPVIVQPTGPSLGLIANQAKLSNAVSAAESSPFETACFPGLKTEKHTTLGTYPKATYQGNAYSSGSAGCGYSPSNIYAAYNLNGLYAEGYNGAGQTVVLIEVCGSPTIIDDANAFSQRFELPPLTASNFSIVYTGPSSCEGFYPGINADVEWAHAIAPGANLDMIVAPSEGFEDLDEAVFYAVGYQLGNVVSDDNAVSESLVGETEANKENLISEIAAVEGIATNFASGESVSTLSIWSPVSVPADLPYATGVGGVSVALNSDDSISFQTAWETHASVLVQGGVIYDPSGTPSGSDGFLFGGAGGPSAFFAKPWFQKGVRGMYRQQPDISWLADPFTGGVIVVSTPTQFPPQVWSVYGGNGLATPMFSALWAVANQEAGTPLGQAAPYLYSMPSTIITDIVPYGSADDPTAVVQESSSSTQRFDPAAALYVTEPQFGNKFYSALWDNPYGAENTTWVLSFGQDYFFKAAVGWDEVTGVGAPSDAKAFADWFASTASKK